MKAWRCKRLVLCFSAIFFLGGCYETSLQGQSDSEVDVETIDGVDTDDGDGGHDIAPDAACPDNDSDGFRDAACGGRDCDDTRNDVFPGAEEVCLDGIDNDCDGLVDGPRLMMTDDLVISGAPGAAESPVLLWTGSEFVAIFSHQSPEGPEARMARIHPSGDSVERETMVLDEDPGYEEPSAAWSGSEIGLAWERSTAGYPEIYLTLLSAAGDRFMEDVRITFDEWMSVSPHIAWTGSEFAVAWVDTRLTESPCTMMGCSYDIYFARVSPYGEKIGEDVRVSDTAVTGRGYWGPVRVSRSGSELGVFWNMYSRLSPDGSEAGPDIFLGHEGEELPAWTGSEYGLLWSSWESDPVDQQGIYFTRRGPAGEERDRTLVEAMEYSNDSFSIAWADGRFGVVWYASEEDGSAIYFQSLTAAGELEGGKIKAAGTLADISHQALAWSGSELGVAWSQNRDSSRNAFFNRIGFCD